MISGERLKVIAKHGRESIFPVTPAHCAEMARELLALRPCRHNWNVLRLVESGGRYQYCTLCGAKKVAG